MQWSSGRARGGRCSSGDALASTSSEVPWSQSVGVRRSQVRPCLLSRPRCCIRCWLRWRRSSRRWPRSRGRLLFPGHRGEGGGAAGPQRGDRPARGSCGCGSWRSPTTSPQPKGARDAAAWLAHHGRRDRAVPASAAPGAGRWLSTRVDRPRPTGRGGQPWQAEVVSTPSTRCPIGSARPRTAAEHRLVDEAARSGPGGLRTLGRRVPRRGRPEVAEGSRDDCWPPRRPAPPGGTFLRRRRLGGGISELVFRGPDAVSDRLSTYLGPSPTPAAPEPGAADSAAGIEDPGPSRGPAALRPAAGCRVRARSSEAVDPQRLPLHGGDATTVLVTVQLDQLLADLGVATIADEPISAGQARRLACTAGIIPVVCSTARAWSSTRAAPAACSPRPSARSSRSPSPPAGPTVWTSPPPGARPTTPADPGPPLACTDLADGLLLCLLPPPPRPRRPLRHPTPARRARPVRPADVRRSSGPARCLDGSRSGTQANSAGVRDCVRSCCEVRRAESCCSECAGALAQQHDLCSASARISHDLCGRGDGRALQTPRPSSDLARAGCPLRTAGREATVRPTRTEEDAGEAKDEAADIVDAVHHADSVTHDRAQEGRQSSSCPPAAGLPPGAGRSARSSCGNLLVCIRTVTGMCKGSIPEGCNASP